MKIISKNYSFDDLLLLPHYSTLESRSQCNLYTEIAGIGLPLPLLSAPMDTVTEENMSMFMWEQGGLGIIHRYNNINKQYAMVKWVKELGARVGGAIGINGDSKERADALAEAGVDIFVIDIAHGHSLKALDMVNHLKNSYDTPVMSGNIVTNRAAYDYMFAGCEVLRVGVGPGSACTTRQVAGVGYPQLSAIKTIREEIKNRRHLFENVSLVSDGGIRTSGDVVKALAMGADAVMVGGILAPFVVAAGKTVSVPVSEEGQSFLPNRTDKGFEQKEPRYVQMKQFRGMASEEALKQRKDKFVVEGESFLVPIRRDHVEFMKQFRDGIQQGFAYLGATDIKQLRDNAVFAEVTVAGYKEGTPHFDKGVSI